MKAPNDLLRELEAIVCQMIELPEDWRQRKTSDAANARSLIINTLYRKCGWSRSQIATKLKMSNALVSKHISTFEDRCYAFMSVEGFYKQIENELETK